MTWTDEGEGNTTRKEKHHFSLGSFERYRALTKNDDIKDAVNIRTKKGIVKMMPIEANITLGNQIDEAVKILGYGVHQYCILCLKSTIKELEGKKNKKNLKPDITLITK